MRSGTVCSCYTAASDRSAMSIMAMSSWARRVGSVGWAIVLRCEGRLCHLGTILMEVVRGGLRLVCRAPSRRGARRRLARRRDATRARTSTSYVGVASGDGRRGKETRGLGYVTITTQETDTVCGPKAVAEGRADEPDGGEAYDSHLVQGLDDIPAHDRPYDRCARWSAARTDLYHRGYGRPQAGRVCSHAHLSGAHRQREKGPNTVNGARG